MGRNYLITGGAGFIGSNFIRYLLEHEADAQVTNLDALTYAGVRATVEELAQNPGHTFVEGNITDANLVHELIPGHDVVVHFAAESHVDRSISGPAPFLETNFVGTGVLLDAAFRHDVPRFIHVSTDEVYGSLPEGSATEDHRLAPSSPYSSSKAGSDLLALSYVVTYGYDVVVTRCTNNYGPYQFPDKVIPLFITNLLKGEKIPLYGDGLHERDWLHVADHCAALHLLVDQAEPGETYNIGSNTHLSNIDLTRMILEAVGRDETWIDWVPDRPGHDRRYALDTTKIAGLGWSSEWDFDRGLEETVEWYRSRRDWWEPLDVGSR